MCAQLSRAAARGMKLPLNILLIIKNNPSQLKLAADFDADGMEAVEQAVAAIKTDKSDLILLDLDLLGMDGLALVKKLKADSQTSSIQIIGITSYPERYTVAGV